MIDLQHSVFHDTDEIGSPTLRYLLRVKQNTVKNCNVPSGTPEKVK